MEKKTKIFIGFRSFIPDAWIKESYEFLSDHGIQIKYEKEKSGIYNHFETGWIAAVLIFLAEILREEVRDGIKSLIKSLLRKIKTKKIQMIRSGGATTDIDSGVSLHYSDGKGKVLKIRFESDVDLEVLDRMVDSGMDLLGYEKTNEFFENLDFADHVKDSVIVNMEYNEADDIWEPINFRKRYDDYMNSLRKADS